MAKTVTEAFEVKVKRQWTGWSVPATSCDQIRDDMSNALREELRKVYDKINGMGKDISNLKRNYPSSADKMRKEMLKEISAELKGSFFDGVLKSLFDEHLKEIQLECDKQKEEIKVLHEKCLAEIKKAKGR